jgi:pimeloyl-ACP methyl ester carboxylesterase
VIAGTSLGANVTLETAALAPERVRGMVIEMPVLDNALLGCALAFTPLMLGLTFGERLWRLGSRGMRMVPNKRLPFLLDIGVEWLQQDPKPSAGVLQGLFFQRVAPPREERRKIEAQALVIGHRRDPVHPFSDSGMLVDELPGGRLLEADSILELRIAPDRLTDEIGEFIDDCWKPRAAARARRAG